MVDIKSESGGCLAGLTVIDASRVIAGPYCGQFLGDHGANVIKIESSDGDDCRTLGAPVRPKSAAFFEALNRNKRGIVIDMNKPEGLELFWELVEKADVLIENFKASTLRSWGVENPTDICKRYPRLVHARITGYGDDGPYGELAGYDAAIQAQCGLMSINGETDGGPLRMGIPVIDLTTGMMSAIATLAALQERNQSGKGQMCAVSLWDVGMGITIPHLPNYLWYGTKPQRWGSAHATIVPYDTFPTGTCPIYIAVVNNRQFATVCKLIGAPEMAQDPRFKNNMDRVKNREELTRRFVKLLRMFDGKELAVQLIENGVPSAPTLEISDVVELPHTKHAQMVIREDDWVGIGFPTKLTRTPTVLYRKPPSIGEHTRSVLLEAGYSVERLDELEKAGTFGPPSS